MNQTLSTVHESRYSTLHKLIFVSSHAFGVRSSLITYANLSKQDANLDPKLNERIPSYSYCKISSISFDL